MTRKRIPSESNHPLVALVERVDLNKALSGCAITFFIMVGIFVILLVALIVGLILLIF